MTILNLKPAAISAMLFLASTAAYANLSPGNSAVPTATTVPAGVPLIADPLTGAYGSYNTPASWKVTSTNGGGLAFVDAVYYDPATKGLDFFYQVQNTYNAGSTRASNTLAPTVNLQGFSGFTTNVFQITNTSTPSAKLFGGGSAKFLKPTSDTITSVARSADGDTLTLDFSSTGIVPKTNSAIFEVQTNATEFDAAGTGTFSWKAAPAVGATGIANAQVFELNSLEPIMTPEPGFYGILSLGLFSLGFVVRRSPKATTKF